MTFFCHHLLPNLDGLKVVTPGVDLEIVQLLAEMVPNIQMNSTTHPIDIPSCQSSIFNRLILHLPLPLEVPDPSHEQSLEVSDPSHEQSLEFTHIESLLYAFHQVSKHAPDFITSDAERLKDLKIRLQYLARCVQTWQKKLRGSMNGSSSPQLKIMALKTTANITAMVRDLFHSPPSFKSGSSLALSWKPAKQGVATKVASGGGGEKVGEKGGEKGGEKVEEKTEGKSGIISTKRKPVTGPEGSSTVSKVRKEVKPYTPPAGRIDARGKKNLTRASYFNRILIIF